MIGLLAILFGLGQPSSTAVHGCEPQSPIRKPGVCEPLYDDGTIVIYSMESVAVGSAEEMQRVRQMTRHCNVDNRIDHVGAVDVAVYDIFNADEHSRACVLGWIMSNAPDLAFSEDRFERKFENARLTEERDLLE